MKNLIMVLTVIAVGLAAFSFAGDANAQAATPEYLGKGGPNGPRGGNGDGSGVPMEMNINLNGVIDDAMAAFIAEGLGISVDDLKSREAEGESLVEIGLSLGYDQEAILKLHAYARITALTQAVIEKVITQDQSDWLISRLDVGQYSANTGLCTGDCTPMAQKMMRNGMRGYRPVAP